MKKLLLLLIFTPVLLQAHGVKYEIIKDKGIGLIVKYDTGEPMVDAEVAIYHPKDYKKPYLTMTTDQQGCFMFLPNISGKWAIVVNDNSGHGVQKTIEVDLSTNSDFSIAKGYVTQKIIMALCVIWGLIGTSLFFISKNKNSSLETKE